MKSPSLKRDGNRDDGDGKKGWKRVEEKEERWMVDEVGDGDSRRREKKKYVELGRTRTGR